MRKACLLSSMVFIAWYGVATAVQWPDLLKPASSVGGGNKDAAVIMSVENYAFVAPIPGARANAAAWYDYLNKTRGIPYEKIFFSADSDVTAEDMKRYAVKAAAAVKEGGTLWYIFIGHGAPSPDGKQGLLVGVDAQQKAESISSRSVPQNELVAALQGSRAGKIVLLIDACFSGRNADGAPLVPGLQPLVVAPAGIAQDPRLTILSAAGGKEFAGQLPGAGRPAFSYLALGGLRGWADADKNGTVTADELRNYTDGVMRAVVKDRTQTPQLQGEGARVLTKTAAETGPDIAGISKSLSAGEPGFQVTSLAKVPKAEKPKAFDPALSGGADWRNMDIDSMERLEKVIDQDKDAGVSPENKVSAWRALSDSAPKYEAMAKHRIEEWAEYIKRRDAVERAKTEKLAARDADWAKLKRLLALKLVSQEDKRRFSVTYVNAYGKSLDENPYLPELIEYLPSGALSQRQTTEIQKQMQEKKEKEQAIALAAAAAKAAPAKIDGVWLGRSELFLNGYHGISNCKSTIRQTGDRTNWQQACSVKWDHLSRPAPTEYNTGVGYIKGHTYRSYDDVGIQKKECNGAPCGCEGEIDDDLRVINFKCQAWAYADNDVNMRFVDAHIVTYYARLTKE